MRDRSKRTLTVVIENVTEAQEIALNDLFAVWQQLGSWGSSRWTGFYADGDGDFRPRITVNGEGPKFTDLLPREQMWKEGDRGEYRIDFDWVGWKLQEIEDKKVTCTKENPDRSKKYHAWVPPHSDDSACEHCGLPWKESAFYRPPVDWNSTPHAARCAEGGGRCLVCLRPWDDPVHDVPTPQAQPEDDARTRENL